MNFNFKRRIILYSSSISVSLCAVKHNYGRSCSLLIGLSFSRIDIMIGSKSDRYPPFSITKQNGSDAYSEHIL